MQGWFNILKKNQVNTHISRIKRGKVHMIISMNAGNSIGKNPIPFHDNSKIGKEKKKHLQNANRASFTWKEVSGMRKKSPSFKKKKV